jgi:hypothetical protein
MTDIFDYLMVWTAPDDQENDMDCAREPDGVVSAR